MTDVQSLVQTTLPASTELGRGGGDLPCVRVANPHGTSQVYFHGAHLSSWVPASGQVPVIWMSRESAFQAGRPIRGGVPICFPWFSAHPYDRDAPTHGFARLRNWTLVAASDGEDGSTRLAFALAGEGTGSEFWPHPFEVTYGVTVGPTLTMELMVRNRGDAPITYEEALHTYYAVQDVREISITGLEHTEYLDKTAPGGRRRQGPESIRFTEETDRVYVNTQATCVIHDPGKRRRIHVHKVGSDSTVVWNPWIDKARALPDFGDLEWPEMVCVETCNVRTHAVTLAPGETHRMSARIELTAL